jgi:uncharacterized membrane protein
MKAGVESHTRRIGWLAAAFFFTWTGLALMAALPGHEWLHQLFLTVCHQIPERSYSISGHPVGLCVRCLWIYIGLGLGHLVFACFCLDLSEKNSLRLLAGTVLLMAADVGLEALGIYHNWPLPRALTGGLFGFACSWFTLRGLSELYLSTRIKTISHESH